MYYKDKIILKDMYNFICVHTQEILGASNFPAETRMPVIFFEEIIYQMKNDFIWNCFIFLFYARF